MGSAPQNRGARERRRVAAVALSLLAALGSSGSADPEHVLDAWIARQARVQAWSAEVTQTRKLKAVSRPLVSEGRVWFRQPDRFRWQLGDPPRTIAVRSAGELIVAYPQLRQAERYALDGGADGPFRHALALLEVGFPVDRPEFDARYELVLVEAVDPQAWRIVVRPAAKQARRLIELIRFEVAASDYTLLATELVFPDGSSMRNDFHAPRFDPPIDESLFAPPIEADYEVARPLESERR